MSGALVLAESRRGGSRDVTAQLVSAARTVCGEDVTLLVIADDAPAPAPAVDVGPVAGILTAVIASPAYEPEVIQAALHAAIRETSPDVVLLAHTNDNLGIAPAVAAASGHGFASDVVRLGRDEDRGLVAHRGVFGGKLEAELTFDGHDTTVLLVRRGAFPAATGPTEAGHAVLSLGRVGSGAIEHLGYEERASTVDLDAATVLIGIGRGVEDASDVPHLEELAARMGGTLVASRPLIDSGWVSPARQVGQSGVSVAPAVYLALGISGAVEHLAGIQAAEMVIAVNNDASAPIFAVADFGVVANVLEVADELRRQLG